MEAFVFFFNDTATTEIYTLSLHDALPISRSAGVIPSQCCSNRSSSSVSVTPTYVTRSTTNHPVRSEEHTSELQSRQYLVCRLLLEKKKPPQPTRRTGGRGVDNIRICGSGR